MEGSLNNETSRRFELAIKCAISGGAIALKHFQDENLAVELKADRSVVTAADREAERQIRRLLEKGFPQDSVVGEEFGTTTGSSGWTWHIDPIDGTQAFMRGVPLFGTLIGVEADGIGRVGVIFLPALGEMVLAQKGSGTQWSRGMRANGEGGFSRGDISSARVSREGDLNKALLCTTWSQSFRERGCPELLDKLSVAAGVTRGWGDCYGYALVATGRAEVMVDPVLYSWDAAPMPVILEEAGGRYTTFDGTVDIHGGTGVATNGLLHAELLRILAG